MRQYFISKGKMRQGPYKLEELLHKSITANTLISYEGSNGWKPASHIKELKPHLNNHYHTLYKRDKYSPEIAIVNNSDEDFGYWLLKTFSLILLIVFIIQVLKAFSE